MNTVYSVGQLNQYIKNMFVQDFLLTRVSVRGEVSNLKDHPSGHIYFTLKDEKAALSVTMFSGNRAKGLSCRLQDGMRVVVTGSVDFYEAAGRTMLYARVIEAEGQGDLYRRFLELKSRLEELGLFDASFKKPIPVYARTVGVVTASSGAALRDIVRISHQRNPYVQLILCPAKVQGEGAAESVAEAIRRMDAYHPDVMIVGRGGGSIEDLWAFNEEIVARAIFDADTPVISAVGHETDFTIADLAADLRASTPSHAAELAVFEYAAFAAMLDGYLQEMAYAAGQKVRELKHRMERDTLSLKAVHPSAVLERYRVRLDRDARQLDQAVHALWNALMKRYQMAAGKLDALSPLSKLTGGYGYLSADGKPVGSVRDVSPGQPLLVTLHDGTVQTEVRKTEPYE
ncbi:MAG: exodeoxyribonuclease VII large subunit [Lachnospiraceae bacterium]|nr:exodeoxyribonuclease VII large subunit [Lachnospiraceae bacterium]MBP5254348.1 exodeoxyribonuclease VII large subunit [Lachnospiraceae bacterium]